MLETSIVIFREGLEAFLIVAIMLAYVVNTGNDHLKKPIFTGILSALLISATTGWHVAELAEDPVWEGALAMIAGAMVASFTVYVMRTAQNFRQDINARLEKSAKIDSIWSEIGVFTFTVLMIAREGMETALMLGALSGQVNAMPMLIGAAIGVALVICIGYLWVSQSTKINIKLFLQVTGIFLILFAAELFLYGLHELSEMNAIPFIGDDMNINFHIWTEIIEAPLVSNMIAFGLLAVPTFWLLGAFIKDKIKPLPAAAE